MVSNVGQRQKVVIMGAGGRDFHNFNILFRHRAEIEVVAFTAAQIPYQQGRCYPAELAGPLYPDGIPIVSEDQLSSLLEKGPTEVVFSYSDISHQQLMAIASRVVACGGTFSLPSAVRTMLPAKVPVLSVCAVRTGCGKSPLVRFVCRLALQAGRLPVVVRHPMAYGNLKVRRKQRFSTTDDLHRCELTLEEREEFEPLLAMGVTVFCGVDYQDTLRAAEAAGDLIVWDGGNNDTPFFRSDLELVVLDPLRAGDEARYYPGLVNLQRADLLVLNKCDAASEEQLATVRSNAQHYNPSAPVIDGTLQLTLDSPQRLQGKRVVVVEDGPTLTHGGMAYGAGTVAARRYGVAEIVDPRSAARGSLQALYRDWPHLAEVLPAMGYSRKQLEELRTTLEEIDCDLIISATPVDLNRLFGLSKPVVQVGYEFVEKRSGELAGRILAWLRRTPSAA